MRHSEKYDIYIGVIYKEDVITEEEHYGWRTWDSSLINRQDYF